MSIEERVEEKICTVLFIDDEKRLRELYGMIYDNIQGYKAIVTGSVDEALGVLDKHPIDVVVTDWNMHGQTGADFFRRAREKGYNGPIMVCTASVDFAYIMDQAPGIAGFVTKPFRVNNLTGKIKTLIGNNEDDSQ